MIIYCHLFSPASGPYLAGGFVRVPASGNPQLWMLMSQTIHTKGISPGRLVSWRFPKIGVSPKSFILVGFSVINHPFGGILISGNPQFPMCSLSNLPSVIMISALILPRDSMGSFLGKEASYGTPLGRIPRNRTWPCYKYRNIYQLIQIILVQLRQIYCVTNINIILIIQHLPPGLWFLAIPWRWCSILTDGVSQWGHTIDFSLSFPGTIYTHGGCSISSQLSLEGSLSLPLSLSLRMYI